MNMRGTLSRWVMQRYCRLWSEFGTEEFERGDASKLLHDDNRVNIVLLDLGKAGWIDVKLEVSDLHQRRY